MKDVVKKDLPEVSGGDFQEGGCIPFPILPGTDAESNPRNPNPIYDSSLGDE